MKRGTIDLSQLDEKVEALCTKLLYTFPECTTKTVEELRKPKLNAWNANKENARDWLALNMMTEGRAGFRAFNEGTRETGREIDFVALRRALAANTPWSDELTESIMPRVRYMAVNVPLKIWSEADGRLLRLRLNRPKANLSMPP